MWPEVGRSIPVSMFSSVDLPLPDGPLIANRLRAGTANETASRMVVWRPLLPITLEIDSARRSVSVVVGRSIVRVSTMRCLPSGAIAPVFDGGVDVVVDLPLALTRPDGFEQLAELCVETL